MTLELLFNGANLFVLPFWGLMILFPNWKWTRALMQSFLPFTALALLYLYLFIGGLSPETAESFSSAGLSDIARLFSEEQVAATAWVHFLVMDLFVGRWIYCDGQTTGVWTRHSLTFCLFAGPLGLLSHIVTRWLAQTLFSKSQPDCPGETNGSQSLDTPA
jgi:hypothetical protein